MPKAPHLKEMVSKLIATPSVSSTLSQFDQSNADVVHTLANWARPLGFDVAIEPIGGSPSKGPPYKANLIATRGRGEGGLVLSGHTDTVPFDEALWESDPFTLTERDDRWYGLGTCDMKSFFAIVLEALREIGDAEFKRPLTLVATADEESTMSGARALEAAALCGARYAVIGEPTELRAVNQHKGIMMLSLLIKGSSGHSSNPELGRSALDATGDVINELHRFRDSLKAHHTNPEFEVAYPTMNLGCIHGGDNPNRICDHVELAFDVRVLPGMDNEEIVGELTEHLRPIIDAHGLTMEFGPNHPPVPPFRSRGNELAPVMAELTDAPLQPVAFATEAPFLTDLGMETIVMGPGSIDQAHQPNEFVALPQLDRAVAIIRALITRYCLRE
ncbi:MAG: acetylornithine deacetylase [Gammaproteobacteria bacterium]|nr:acetylornithine deacetylase [Gammaproteobacteria bacterium]